MKVQVPVLSDHKGRRIVVERGCHVVDCFGRDGVRHQMRAIRLEITNVSGGDQRSCNELRSPAAWHEIGEDLVIAWFRKGDVDRPGAVRLLFGMNVLEILHVLADDEKMVLTFVYDFEFLDRLATAWMKNAKQQLCLLTRLNDRRNRLKVEPVITNIKWGRPDEIHAAARTFPGDVLRVVGMHRTHPRRVLFRLRRLNERETGRRRGEQGR